MTNAQVLTLAVAMVVPLSLLLYSNSRITEAKETLRAEMQAGFTKILSEIGSLKAQLKLHEVEHHR